MSFEMLDELRDLELAHFTPERHDGFRAFCRRAIEGIDKTDVTCHLRQWHLEPATPAEQLGEVIFADELDKTLDGSWRQVDPRSQSEFSLDERSGWLRIKSPGGVDLWRRNLAAPRLVRTVEGDFAVETQLEITDVEDRTFAGLLVWQDERNFVRFEQRLGVGKYADNIGEMFFEVHSGDDYRAVGRGLLDASVVTLRIEREGAELRALCRAEGGEWQTCGKATVELSSQLLVGVHTFPHRGESATAWFDYVKVLKPATASGGE